MKYGVPSKINGARNPEYWRRYHKTQAAKDAVRNYKKKLSSKRWLKSVERYYTRGNEPIGDAVRELTIDDIKSLL